MSKVAPTQKYGYVDIKQASKVRPRKLKSYVEASCDEGVMKRRRVRRRRSSIICWTDSIISDSVFCLPPITRLQIWKRRWVVLTKMSDLSSEEYLAKLDLYDSEAKWLANSSDKMTFVLENVTCIRPVKSKTHKHAFEVIQEHPVLVISGGTELDSYSWIVSLQQIFTPDHIQDKKNSYHVTVSENEDSRKWQLSGDYTLSVCATCLSLASPDDTRVVSWALNSLVRFNVEQGSVPGDRSSLLIECGPKSTTGHSFFNLLSDKAEDILCTIRQSICLALTLKQNVRMSSTRHRSPSVSISEKSFQSLLESHTIVHHIPQSVTHHIPQSGVNHIPQSGVNHIPQSGVNHIAQSGVNHIPQSVANHIPQSGVNHIPQSVANHIPQSGVNHIPQSVTHHIPQSVANHIPQSGVNHIPQSVTHHIPQSVANHIPQSSVNHIPQSVTHHIPQSVANHIPQSSVNHIPQSVTHHIPQSVANHIPQSSVNHIPQSSVNHIPQSGVNHIPQSVAHHIPQSVAHHIHQSASRPIPTNSYDSNSSVSNFGSSGWSTHSPSSSLTTGHFNTDFSSFLEMEESDKPHIYHLAPGDATSCEKVKFCSHRHSSCHPENRCIGNNDYSEIKDITDELKSLSTRNTISCEQADVDFDRLRSVSAVVASLKANSNFNNNKEASRSPQNKDDDNSDFDSAFSSMALSLTNEDVPRKDCPQIACTEGQCSCVMARRRSSSTPDLQAYWKMNKFENVYEELGELAASVHRLNKKYDSETPPLLPARPSSAKCSRTTQQDKTGAASKNQSLLKMHSFHADKDTNDHVCACDNARVARWLTSESQCPVSHCKETNDRSRTGFLGKAKIKQTDSLFYAINDINSIILHVQNVKRRRSSDITPVATSFVLTSSSDINHSQTTSQQWQRDNLAGSYKSMPTTPVNLIDLQENTEDFQSPQRESIIQPNEAQNDILDSLADFFLGDGDLSVTPVVRTQCSIQPSYNLAHLTKGSVSFTNIPASNKTNPSLLSKTSTWPGHNSRCEATTLSLATLTRLAKPGDIWGDDTQSSNESADSVTAEQAAMSPQTG